MKAHWVAWTLASTLIASSSNCFAQFNAPSPIIWMPNRYNCLDVLGLERFDLDALTDKGLNMKDAVLALEYGVVQAWLAGYFSGQNVLNYRTSGTHSEVIAKAKSREWMTWVFSYCRQYPQSTLGNAAETLYQLYFPKSTTRQ